MSGFRIDLTLREDDEAHIAIAGAVGGDETRRIVALVQALMSAGARQVIVDLDHVGKCDPALNVFLEQQRQHLAAVGGWMMVDGTPSSGVGGASSLMEIFDIYRHVHGPNGSTGPAVIDRRVDATVSD